MMKVILHQDVADLGAIGELVTVKDGYARNYLVPQGLAVKASMKNVAELEHQKRMVERHKLKVQQGASELAESLARVSCTIPVLVGEQDKLFGSVTTRDIEEALAAEGVKIHRRQIELSEPIRSVGVYTVDVRLHSDVMGKLKVWVVAK
jgi:large subunit ribosomal protein L9